MAVRPAGCHGRAAVNGRGWSTVSVSLSDLVLEVAARQIIPALVTELSAQAFRQAARSATEWADSRPPGPLPTTALHAGGSTTVVSEMPGRVRLRVEGLRGNSALAAGLRERLLRLPGVRGVDASAVTGTALVQYDLGRTDLPRILATAESPAPGAACRAAGLGSSVRLALVGSSGALSC